MTENVVVLGGSGGIGREIVAQLTHRGHRVVAVARDAQRLQALKTRAATEHLTLLSHDVADERAAAQLASRLRELGRPVTAVVGALRGRLEGGRLLDRSAADLHRALDQEVVANFVAAKHLLPLLAESRRDDSRYLMLGGPMAGCAWSGYAHVSIAAAALQMLTRALREEAKELPVIVQQLQINTPVRTEKNEQCSCPEWLTAAEVAARAVSLIERRDTPVPIVELGASASRPAPVRAARSAS